VNGPGWFWARYGEDVCGPHEADRMEPRDSFPYGEPLSVKSCPQRQKEYLALYYQQRLKARRKASVPA